MSYQTDLYDSMVQQVVTLTARSDLEAEIEIAVATATSNAHHTDFYPRDLNGTTVQLPNAPLYVAQLDIMNLFPRIRALDEVKPVDLSGNVLIHRSDEIEVIEIGDLYDADGYIRDKVAYLAGNSVNVRDTNGFSGLLLTWYSSPSVRRDQYDSWIAQLMPQLIIFWASAIVFGTNGNEEKSARYMKIVDNDPRSVGNPPGLVQQLKANYLVGKAR